MALKGEVYNPNIGFSTIGNVYGREPQVSVQSVLRRRKPACCGCLESEVCRRTSWAKLMGDGKTVIRAGYGQIYSRLNGVGLVLIPLLGVGLGQPNFCIGASSSGQCLGTGGVTPATAFRIGTDGLTAPFQTPSKTLPQPSYPGINGSRGGGRGFGAGSQLPAGHNLQLQLQHSARNQAQGAV